MHQLSILAVLVAISVAMVAGADKKLTYKQVQVHVMEKSGGMKFTAMAAESDNDDSNEDSKEEDATTQASAAEPTTQPADAAPSRKRRATDDDNVVTFMLKSLTEVNAAGEAIGADKADSQAVADFSNVMFTIGEPMMDATIPYSQNKDSEEIKAAMISYHVALGAGKAKVDVFIAKEAGNVTLGSGDATEKTMVEEGQIKFSVMIEGWVWCTEAAANCMNGETKEVGAALDLVIAVQGEGEAELKDLVAGMSIAFDLGNGNHMFVSKHVKTTDNADAEAWVAMAENFPKPENMEDSMTQMTMRFPWFEKSIWYDPSVLLKMPEGGDGVSGSSTLAASLTVVVLTLLATLIRV